MKKIKDWNEIVAGESRNLITEFFPFMVLKDHDNDIYVEIATSMLKGNALR